jgi:hypothetical protein
VRLSSASPWDAGQPIGYPKEVEPCRGQNMAQMGSSQAHIAAPAQPQHPDTLREDGFNAGAPCGFSHILCRLLPLAAGFECKNRSLGAGW